MKQYKYENEDLIFIWANIEKKYKDQEEFIFVTLYFDISENAVGFKEITFLARSKGKNSININKIFKIGIKALKDFYGFKKILKNKKDKK